MSLRVPLDHLRVEGHDLRDAQGRSSKKGAKMISTTH
jgi:hypothetical protein